MWDKGWTRIWEPVTYEQLDAAFRADIAARVARYITTLEPILRDELPADVAWSLAPERKTPRRQRVRAASTASRVLPTRR